MLTLSLWKVTTPPPKPNSFPVDRGHTEVFVSTVRSEKHILTDQSYSKNDHEKTLKQVHIAFDSESLIRKFRALELKKTRRAGAGGTIKELLPLVGTGGDSVGWLGGKAKKRRSDPDAAAGLLCGLGSEPSPS